MTSPFGIVHELEPPSEISKGPLTRALTTTTRAIGSTARGARESAEGVGDVMRLASRHPRLEAAVLKHPQASLATGIVFPHALKHGLKATGALQMRGTARALEGSPGKARALAETLAPAKSPGWPEGKGLKKLRGFFRNAKQQRKLYADTATRNADVARFRPLSENWQGTFTRNRAIRRAAESGAPLPGVAATLVRPTRTADRATARGLAAVKGHSNPAETPPTFRTMHMAQGHKEGDVVDFGRLSSWTTDKKVAERIAETRSKVPRPVQRLVGVQNPKGSKPTLYRREGPGEGVNLSGSSPYFGQSEWILGGKHRVTSVPTPERPYYGVTPLGKSAFGVIHT